MAQHEPRGATSSAVFSAAAIRRRAWRAGVVFLVVAPLLLFSSVVYEVMWAQRFRGPVVAFLKEPLELPGAYGPAGLRLPPDAPVLLRVWRQRGVECLEIARWEEMLGFHASFAMHGEGAGIPVFHVVSPGWAAPCAPEAYQGHAFVTSTPLLEFHLHPEDPGGDITLLAEPSGVVRRLKTVDHPEWLDTLVRRARAWLLSPPG